MQENYKVSINVGPNYGYIQYNEQTKTIQVVFPNEKIKQLILDYLNKPQKINIPKNNSICEFEVQEKLAALSKEDFQLVLGRLWNTHKVHVNWSIPVN